MTEPRDRLTALREDFDRAFAEPPAAPSVPMARVVAIRVSGAPYALRLDQLGGLIAMPHVVTLVGAPPDCLGVAGMRGRMVPVFALALLLGRPAEPPRWVALTATAEPVALAFGELEGLHDVPAEALLPTRPGTASDDPVTVLLREEPPRGVIDLNLLHETLNRVAGQAAPHKEKLS